MTEQNNNNADKNVSHLNKDDFKLPTHQLKKLRRQDRKKKVITDRAHHTLVKGAPEPVRDVFIYRVSKDTDTDTLVKCVKDNKFNVINLSCVYLIMMLSINLLS